MTKRTAVWFVAVLAAAGISVLQWGCGGASNPPPNEAAAPPPAAETAPAPAPAEAPAAAPRPAPSAPAPRPAAPAPKPEPPPPPPPRTFTLKAGTPLSVFTTAAISTQSAKNGDAFSAVLAKPITDGDWTIAKEGARVEGMVVESDPGGKVKGVASMTLTLQKLTLADGRTVELATSTVSQEAKTSKGKDAKKIGIGAGIGTAIGAIAGGGKGAAIGAAVGGGAGTAAALATRGDPAVVPSEAELSFTLSSPITITKQ
jgi:hypothetical protein